MNTYLKRIAAVQSYDKLLAYGGILLGVALASLLALTRLYAQIGVPVTVLVVCIAYLLRREHLAAPTPREAPGIAWPSAALSEAASVAMVGIAAVAGLIVIGVSANSLHRPVWVFAVLALLPGLILAQELWFGKKRFLLVQALILAATIVIARVTVFPYNGGDTWTHLHNAAVIWDGGTVLAVSDAYRDYPLYPALLAILSGLTGVGADDIARFVNVLVALSCILLLYSLAGKFFSSSQSLVLVLLLVGCKWFIYWTTAVIAMTMAALFYCLIVVILLRRLDKQAGVREIAALLLLSAVIPFFHPVVAATAVLLFLGFWVLETFVIGGRGALNQRSLITLTLFVVVVVLTQWIYFGEFIFARTIRDLTNAIFREGELTVQVAKGYRSPLATVLDELNFYGLLALTGIELMRQIRLRTERINLYTGLLGLAFVGFGYTVQLIALKPVVPDRWFLFGCLLLVFPASSTFMNLFRRESRWGRSLAVVALVAYFFSGLTNNQVNKDNPLYSGNISYQSDLSASQHAGLVMIEELLRSREITIRTDSWLWNYLQYAPGGEQAGYWKEARLDSFDGIFPIRAGYFDTPYFGYSLMAGFAAEIERERPQIAQFYDSGDLQWLERVGDQRLDRPFANSAKTREGTRSLPPPDAPDRQAAQLHDALLLSPVLTSMIAIPTVLWVFLPGFLLAIWLFPGERSLWHLSVGSGLGIALIGLIALALSYLPFGVTFLSVMTAAGVLSALFMACFWPALQVAFPPVSIRFGKRGALPAIGAVCVFLLFLAVVPAVAQARKESYTEFSIVGAAEPLPWQRRVAAGEELGLTLAVASSEGAAESFEVRVTTEGKLLQVLDLGTLRPGESARLPIHLPPRERRAQRYDLALYKGGSQVPYRSLYFWVKARS